MNIHVFNDKEGHFNEAFDRDTGMYIRTDVLDEHGRATGVDPFARTTGPALLDIGVMGGCRSALICPVPCYQGRKHPGATPDMAFNDFKRLIDESVELGLMQVALGGAGNPDEHSCFEGMISYCQSRGVVPSYTTAGTGLTEQSVNATAKYCGAVAVSWHHTPGDSTLTCTDYTFRAINMFAHAGAKVNVHMVVSRETIAAATEIIDTGTWPTPNGRIKLPVNALVLLWFKPIGVGGDRQDLLLKPGVDDENVNRLTTALTNAKPPFAVGLDSCSAPMLVSTNAGVHWPLMDACEGARFSAYVSPNMRMTPCSFDQTMRWGVDLHKHSVAEAWTSPQFNDFRERLRTACPACTHRTKCLGGCPVAPHASFCVSAARQTA